MKQLPRKKRLVIACAHALAVMFTTQSFAADEDISNIDVKSKVTSEKKRKLSSERKRNEEIEIIEVTGYAGSVEKALAAKRFANGVIDSIIAEDIGKMPDSNVAEALQRMAGISINRDGGEGTTISIRGLNPELNQVSINGQTVDGAGTFDPDNDDLNEQGAGGVNFSNMSSDMLSRIEVIKTPSASTVEGSIGGRVNLRTAKPLNGKGRSFSVRIKQNYNELSENMDPVFGFNFSDQFLDNTFGIALGASVERRRGRTDKVSTGGWRLHDDITHDSSGFEYLKAADSQDTTQPDINTPLFIRDRLNNVLFDSNYVDVSDTVGTSNLVSAPQSGYAMGRTTYLYEEKDQKRKNINLTLQYKPNDSLSTHIDLSISDLESYKSRARYAITYDDEPFLQSSADNEEELANRTRGLNGVFSGMDIDENGTVVRATNLIGRIDNRADESLLNTLTLATNIGFEYDSDVWITSGRLGYSNTTEDTDGFNSLRSFTGSQVFGYDARFDPKLPEFVWGAHDENGIALTLPTPSNRPTGIDRNIFGDVVGADGNNYTTPFGEHGTIRDVDSSFREFESENYSFQLDTEYLLDDSEHFTSLMFGIMHTFNDKNTFGDGLGFTAQFTGNSLFINEPGRSTNDFIGDNFLGGQTSSGIAYQAPVTGWVTPNFDGVNQEFLRLYNDWYSLPENDLEGVHTNITDISQARGTINPSSSSEVEQSNSAVYIQVNVDTLDGRLLGDFGLRVVNTDIDLLGYTGTQSNANECINTPTFDRDLCLERYTEVTASNSYVNVLPSANFVYLINDDLLVRTSLTKAMSRPPSRYLKTTFRVAANSADTATIHKGNPNLDPVIANQLDFGIEWYFDKGAVLSANFFYKDLKNFIYDRITRVEDTLLDFDGTIVDHPDPDVDETEQDDETGKFIINPHFVKEGINGESAKVKGLEARYSQSFTTLPGDFSGLGVDLNYTLADSSATYEGLDINDQNISVDFTLEDQSKHTVNASIFWEKYGHSARLSYNYRSDSLARAISGENDSLWNEAYEQFDFSGRYSLSKNMKIGLQVTNLLDVGQYQYSLAHENGSPIDNNVFKNRLGSYQFNGRTVRLTIDGRF